MVVYFFQSALMPCRRSSCSWERMNFRRRWTAGLGADRYTSREGGGRSKYCEIWFPPRMHVRQLVKMAATKKCLPMGFTFTRFAGR